VTKLVGSDITNAVLQTANGSNHKSTNDYTLFAVMAAAINGTNQPSTINVLEQFREDVVAELILMVNPLYQIMSVAMLNYDWCLALKSVLSTSWVWPK
jgi:hypothetical protein